MKTIILEKKQIDIAVEILNKGGLVVFPTETVWGLGANAEDDKAVEKIFLAKGRPQDNPVIVHIHSINLLEKYAIEIPSEAIILFERFSPGPLTVVLKRNLLLCNKASAGLDTIGLRIPSDHIALELLKNFNKGIAAPSANISGKPSPTNFETALLNMDGKVDAIIKGDPSVKGLESTIVSLVNNEYKILRPGFITKEMIEDVLRKKVILSFNSENKPIAPGMKYPHYKPNAKVYLTDKINLEYIHNLFKNNKIALIYYKNDKIKNSDYIINFNSPEEYAANIYNTFYEFDKKNVDIIIAEKCEETGIGIALMNRLYKSSDGNFL